LFFLTVKIIRWSVVIGLLVDIDVIAFSVAHAGKRDQQAIHPPHQRGDVTKGWILVMRDPPCPLAALVPPSDQRRCLTDEKCAQEVGVRGEEKQTATGPPPCREPSREGETNRTIDVLRSTSVIKHDLFGTIDRSSSPPMVVTC
jgi:hypothetical protein